MTVDEDLAERVRSALSDRGLEWQEKRMFGALIFMVGGAIALGARGGGGLLVRCDPDEGATLLGRAGPGCAQPARMGAREMGPSWIDVSPDAVAADEDLAAWVAAALRR